MDWLHGLTAHEFRRAFRMTRLAFFKLLRLVRDDLGKNVPMAKRSSGSPVTPLIKLAVTIRWLVPTALPFFFLRVLHMCYVLCPFRQVACT